MESMALAGGEERASRREGWIRVESSPSPSRRVQNDARDTRAAVDATLERKSGVGLPPPDAGRRGRLRPSPPRECREIFVGRVDATRQSGPRPFREWTRVVLLSNVVSLLRFPDENSSSLRAKSESSDFDSLDKLFETKVPRGEGGGEKDF